MSKTEIRYQKNGKETILKGWIADCFLSSFERPRALEDYYEITGFESFIIKGKKFQKSLYKINKEFVISKDTFFCLEDCSFEDINRVTFYGDKISLKRISSTNFMSVDVKENKDTEIVVQSTPNAIAYSVESEKGKALFSGDGSDCLLSLNGVSHLQIHDAQNLDFGMLDRWIKEIEIVRSNVSLLNLQDAKVTLQDSRVHVTTLFENNEITLNHSKLLIDNAYFIENQQEAIIYDKDGTLYVNDDVTFKSKICFVSVLKALQNKLETQLDAREESIILKAKRKESERLLEISSQIAMLQKEQEELLNYLDKTSDNIYLSLTKQKIKELE